MNIRMYVCMYVCIYVCLSACLCTVSITIGFVQLCVSLDVFKVPYDLSTLPQADSLFTWLLSGLYTQVVGRTD